MKQWDIVWCIFPDSRFLNFKPRPALIISCDAFNHPEYLVAFITSQDAAEVGDIRIDKDHPEFDDTGLPKPSTIRVGKLLTIPVEFIDHLQGKAGYRIRREVKKQLKFICDL